MKTDRVEINSSYMEWAITHLYQSRKAAREAKRKRSRRFQQLYEEIDGCQDRDGDYGYPCYQQDKEKEEYCSFCGEIQPLHEDFHRKSAIAGAALRTVLKLGKELSNKETTEDRL